MPNITVLFQIIFQRKLMKEFKWSTITRHKHKHGKG